MNGQDRFIELWNEYLEGELDESGVAELRALVDSDDHLLQIAAESYQMHRLLGLVAQDSMARRDTFVRATVARLPQGDRQFVDGVMQHVGGAKTTAADRRSNVRNVRRIATAAAVMLLVTGIALWQRNKEFAFARITDLNEPVQWIGDGGQLVSDLKVGMSLDGGTLESLSAESWVGIEFRDGSTVTISGQSSLTVSGRDPKELHLRGGGLFASVAPQSAGKPMLIHTPTAVMEVLGTRLDVNAEPSSTRLRVNEGRVRITRLVDGRLTDVPADYQIVATVDPRAEFNAERRPSATEHWQSHLAEDASHGKWVLEPGETIGSLRAMPYLRKNRESGPSLYYSAVLVPRSEPRPVALTSGARFLVRGWLEFGADAKFAFSASHPKRGFAGKYEFNVPAEAFPAAGETFELELPLADFRPRKDKFDESPIGLELDAFWCHTFGQDAGLRVFSVDLIPDDVPMTARQSTE